MAKINYAKLAAEQSNPRSRSIDSVSIKKMIGIMSREDKLVSRAVAKANKQIVCGVILIVQALQKGGRLFFAGAGTSGRFGVMEAAECPPTFNTSPSLIQAVMAGGRKAVFRSEEGAEDREEAAFKIFIKKLRGNDIVVGIAASGVTPFVRGALKAAREKGVSTVLVTCADVSSLKPLANCIISAKVGPELITGSTRLKAGTATKLILNRLTVASMIKLGKVYQNWMVDVQPRSRKLKARALRLIEHLGKVSPEKAERCLLEAKKNVKLAILIARKGWNYQTAFEKLKTASGFLGRALSYTS